MAAAVSPLRFFRIVPPVSPLIGWTYVLVCTAAALLIAYDPTRASRAMVPVLLLQLFAASSGFEVPGRRGHYDLLLTSGSGRVRMALVHWGSSIVHGLAAWLVLILIERVASSGSRGTLLSWGTCAAVCLVSTLPWAMTIRLPRFSGGIGWLLVLALSSSVWPVTGSLPGSPALAGRLVLSWQFLVYPPSLIGHALRLEDVVTAAPALVCACCAMVAACRWIARASVPLEAAQ